MGAYPSKTSFGTAQTTTLAAYAAREALEGLSEICGHKHTEAEFFQLYNDATHRRRREAAEVAQQGRQELIEKNAQLEEELSGLKDLVSALQRASGGSIAGLKKAMAELAATGGSGKRSGKSKTRP